MCFCYVIIYVLFCRGYWLRDHSGRAASWTAALVGGNVRRIRTTTSDSGSIRLTEGSLEVKLPTIWTWKSRGGKSQRRGEKKREDQRRERVRGKKMQVGKKVQKSRFTVFFQWFLAPEGRKVGSLAKAAGAATFGQVRDEKLQAVAARSTFRSQNAQNTSKHLSFGALLEVETTKKCTPLWREAHFEVKRVKNWRSRTTFGSWDVEKVQCTPLWREAHVQVKMHKTHEVRSIFWSWDVEKVHAVVARSKFPSQNVKTHVWTTFGRSDVVSRGRRKGLCTLWKVSKTWGSCSSFNYNHHYTTLHPATMLQLQLLLPLQVQLHYIYTTPHYT